MTEKKSLTDRTGKKPGKRVAAALAAAVLLLLLCLYAIGHRQGWFSSNAGTMDGSKAVADGFREKSGELLLHWQQYSIESGHEPYEVAYDGKHVFYLGAVPADNGEEALTGLVAVSVADGEEEAAGVYNLAAPGEIWENLQFAEDGNLDREYGGVLTYDNVQEDGKEEGLFQNPRESNLGRESFWMYQIDAKDKTPHLLCWDGTLYWFAEDGDGTALYRADETTGAAEKVVTVEKTGAAVDCANPAAALQNGLISWISEEKQLVRMDLQQGKQRDILSVNGIEPDAVQCNENFMICTDVEGNTYAYSYLTDTAYFLDKASSSEEGWQVYLRGDLVWMACGSEIRLFDLLEMATFVLDPTKMGLRGFDGLRAAQNGSLLVWSRTDNGFVIISK